MISAFYTNQIHKTVLFVLNILSAYKLKGFSGVCQAVRKSMCFSPVSLPQHIRQTRNAVVVLICIFEDADVCYPSLFKSPTGTGVAYIFKNSDPGNSSELDCSNSCRIVLREDYDVGLSWVDVLFWDGAKWVIGDADVSKDFYAELTRKYERVLSDISKPNFRKWCPANGAQEEAISELLNRAPRLAQSDPS